jgi:hypothetical protein
VIVVDFERIMGAINWRIGSLRKDADAGEDWKTIESWLRDDPKRLDTLAAKMAEPLIEAIRWGLLHSETDAEGKPWLSPRWDNLKRYLQEEQYKVPDLMAIEGASYIARNLKAENLDIIPSKQGLPTSDTQECVEGVWVKAALTEAESIAEEKQVPIDTLNGNDEAGKTTLSRGATSEEDQTTVTMNEAEESSNDEMTVQPESSPPDSNPPSLSTHWRYLPVPDDPDKHDEFDQRADFSPEGLRIIGARVRGKKHKHEGTNCDDWFEIRNSGVWTIIAVSDGAGSKVFSRIGAKESCEAAKNKLGESLAEHRLNERENWSNDTFARDKQSGVFAEDDLEYVQEALHSAMAKAYEAVEARARELADSTAHEAILGRKVVMDDLSGTLLLAVHTTVMHEGARRSFVLTCQIGDGMLAALSTNGGLQLLGIPDSGEFAGQTEFLTSKKKMEKANLTGKTFPFFGPMQALMVMTDGVADDYFPNDPGMLRLYGDLVINGVLNLAGSNQKKDLEDIRLSLAETKLTTMDAVQEAGLAVSVETITAAEDSPSVLIRSIVTYAEKLGLTPEEVVKSRPLLIAGTLGDPMCDKSLCDEKNKQDMLRVWLDSYHVRGSFDDRTLVVLYREVAG